MNLDFRRRAMFCGMGKIALPINTRLLTHFDNNCEDSTGLNTPEFFGTASYKKGKFKNSVFLDGNSCVNVPYNADYLVFGTSDFTIAGWFKWDGTRPNGTLPRLFSQQYCYNNTYPMAGICVWINADGEIVWRVQRSSSAAVVSSKDTNVAMPVNEWAHLAMVRNGTALKLYLNGTEIGTATFNASYSVYQNTNSTFRIGAGSGRASTSRTEAADFFSGEIDEFIVTIGTAIWTEAFTPPVKPYADYLTLGSLPYGKGSF